MQTRHSRLLFCLWDPTLPIMTEIHLRTAGLQWRESGRLLSAMFAVVMISVTEQMHERAGHQQKKGKCS